MAVMGVLGLAMILVPFIPGVRDVPRRIPIYKLNLARALPGVCRLIESPAFRRRSPRQRARIRTMLHRRIRDPRRWVERRAARCSLSSCSLTSAAT